MGTIAGVESFVGTLLRHRQIYGREKEADVYSYSRAPEILEYFRSLARKYNLYRSIKLSHKVIEARWEEERSIWKIRVENTITGEVIEDWCHFMITGSGILK